MSFIRQTLHHELADIKKDDKFEFRAAQFHQEVMKNFKYPVLFH
jgi:hypothetical protein